MAILCAALGSFGCTGATQSGDGANTAGSPSVLVESSSSAKSNPEELSLLINIPFEPDDLVWKEAADPRRITAVFKFYPEDTAKLLEAAKSEGPSEPASVNVETWFPEELLTQAEVTGGDKLNGTAYSAKQFLQPPFTEGRFVHIDGSDFVIVEATAK